MFRAEENGSILPPSNLLLDSNNNNKKHFSSVTKNCGQLLPTTVPNMAWVVCLPVNIVKARTHPYQIEHGYPK
jgi:hypothetical protein